MVDQMRKISKMRVSRSEFEATVRKAARGAGWSPSLAEDLSRATAALAATGGESTLWAIQMIEREQSDLLANTIAAFELALSGEPAIVPASSCSTILLVACSRSVAAEHDVGFDLEADGAELRIVVTETKPTKTVEIFVQKTIWERLQALAHKSYVPASVASRLAGAGAGLTDND